jgi:hypothetical protein
MTGDRRNEPVDYFGVYRCTPEITLPIPAIDGGQPPLVISIAALGGGTVGRAYAGNDWVYAVHLDGVLVASGADLHCGDVPQTHWHMAAVLAACLADNTAGLPGLASQRDRLSLWADDAGAADTGQ